MHSGMFILEAYWLMYHSTLPHTIAVWVFVIFYENFEGLNFIHRGVSGHRFPYSTLEKQ